MQLPNPNRRIQEVFQSLRSGKTTMWMVYFVYWAGMAAVLPFISLYYESLNIGGAQIGQLNSIRNFITFFSSILFAFLSDVSKKHRLVLRVCALGMMAALLLYPSSRIFTAFIPIVLLYSIFDAPINPIMDAISVATLENPRDYGKLRVGGSYGWGILVLATGFLIDRINMGLPIIFYIQTGFWIILFALTFLLPHAAHTRPLDDKKPSLSDVWRLVRQPGILMVIALAMAWGIGQSGVANFLFLHIKSMGGSSTLMGTSMATSLIGEIVVFAFTSRILKTLGPKRMMVSAFLIQFVWFMGLTQISDPNLIPYFQVFGGASFALIQAGSVAYLNEVAPSRLSTTAQAIRGGTLLGLGFAIGSVINGFIYQNSGSIVMFRLMAFLALGAFIFGVSAYAFARNRSANA